MTKEKTALDVIATSFDEYSRLQLHLEDGRTLRVTKDAYPTDRVFPGCFMQAKIGEEFIAEYIGLALDVDTSEFFFVFWRFTAIKEDRSWEADDEIFDFHNQEFIFVQPYNKN